MHPIELALLGLSADYESEFNKRKKHLFDVNRNFKCCKYEDKRTSRTDERPFSK